MKKLIAVVVVLLAFNAWAETENEEVCIKETVNYKGWTTHEEVPCQPGQKSIKQIARESIKQIEREEEAQKRKCGKDYMRLRIGMKIQRLQECYGATYETKTVGKGGVVETYRTVFDWVYIKNGVVIGYTERTDN